MKLDDWMRENRWRNADLARELGLEQPHMHKIVRGQIRPTVEIVARIEELSRGAVKAKDLAEAFVGLPKAVPVAA